MGGTIDRTAVRETQHGNHATHWVTTYVQQTVHVTQRHSYLHQSRHRDSATANVTQPSQLFTPGLLIGEHLRYRHIVIPLPWSTQWPAANIKSIAFTRILIGQISARLWVLTSSFLNLKKFLIQGHYLRNSRCLFPTKKRYFRISRSYHNKCLS